MVALIASAAWTRGYLSYTERVTGVALASRASEVDIFDNGEYVVVAHVRIDEDPQAFAAEYGLNTTPISLVPWVDYPEPENRSFPDDADLRYLARESESNGWLVVIDQNSDRVWIVVFYADPAGGYGLPGDRFR